ncbi:trigger factor [Lachnospiraceae bacterium 42-17]|jgi:trigger factor|nr:trigger factor [Oscillospiraceae bacterium]
MKKKSILLLIIITLSIGLASCRESSGLETDSIKISQYKEIEIEPLTSQTAVTDEDVEYAIQTILELRAEAYPVSDRAALYGDTVNIDFIGEINGNSFEGGTENDFSVTIGSEVLIPGFEDSIIGHNIGDTYIWEGIFPENYKNFDYVGKHVTYTITLKSITELKKPELTNEFVKSVSKTSNTIEEYRNEIKQQLQQEAEVNYKESLTEEIWQTILKNTEVIKYPEDEINKIFNEQVKPYKSMAKSLDMEYKDFIESQIELSVDEFEGEIKDAAKIKVKQSLICNAIAEAENIELDDKTYKQQLEIIAKMYGFKNVEDLKKEFSDDELKEISLNNLVKSWLVTHNIKNFQ